MRRMTIKAASTAKAINPPARTRMRYSCQALARLDSSAPDILIRLRSACPAVQRFALPVYRWSVELAWEQDSVWAWKILENTAGSPSSTVLFVGRLLIDRQTFFLALQFMLSELSNHILSFLLVGLFLIY
jgi:hypothetical protein